MKPSTIASAFTAASVLGGTALPWPIESSTSNDNLAAAVGSSSAAPESDAGIAARWADASHRAGHPRSIFPEASDAVTYARSADASHRAGHPRDASHRAGHPRELIDDVSARSSDADPSHRAGHPRDASHRAGHPRDTSSASADCDHTTQHGFALGGALHEASFAAMHRGDNATVDAADSIVNAFKGDNATEQMAALHRATALFAGTSDGDATGQYATDIANQAITAYHSSDGTQCHK